MGCCLSGALVIVVCGVHPPPLSFVPRPLPQLNRMERRLLEEEARLAQAIAQLDRARDQTEGDQFELSARVAAAEDRTAAAIREMVELQGAAEASAQRCREQDAEIGRLRSRVRRSRRCVWGLVRVRVPLAVTDR